MKRSYSRSADNQHDTTLELPLARIRRRGRTQSNLWIFESPKNAKRLTITGDLNFMLCVLLEGDTSVARYKVEPGPYHIVLDAQPVNVVPDLEVERYVGKTEWWEVTRSPLQNSKQRTVVSQLARAAAIAGVTYSLLTDKDLLGKAVAFDNWLMLCAAITRARHLPAHHEASFLRNQLENLSNVSVRDLLREPGIDPALMISTIARFLQAGRASAELDTKFFCEETVLRARFV